jgi:hypothetical protein
MPLVAKRPPTRCAFRGQRVGSFAALKGSAANVFAANVYQQDELRSVKRVIRSFAALKKIGRLQKFGGRN